MLSVLTFLTFLVASSSSAFNINFLSVSSPYLLIVNVSSAIAITWNCAGTVKPCPTSMLLLNTVFISGSKLMNIMLPVKLIFAGPNGVVSVWFSVGCW